MPDRVLGSRRTEVPMVVEKNQQNQSGTTRPDLTEEVKVRRWKKARGGQWKEEGH